MSTNTHAGEKSRDRRTMDEPTDDQSADAEWPKPVPMSWIEHGDTNGLAAKTPFLATQIDHDPHAPTSHPLDSERYELAGNLVTRYVALGDDAAIVDREDAIRDTQTGNILPRCVFHSGVESWQAVLGRHHAPTMSDSATERDREIIATVWAEVEVDV